MTTDQKTQELVELGKDESTSDTVVAEAEPAQADTSAAVDGSSRGGAARIGLAIALVLALAAVLAWGYLFFVVKSDDNALAPDKQQEAVDAAAAAATALLTYKSATVDADLEAANSLVTGTFADYYKTFTRDVVAPAAKEKRIDTSASVVGAGISEFSVDTAEVTLFVNQSTTTADSAAPVVTSTTIRVGLERHGDQWLVKTFDPA